MFIDAIEFNAEDKMLWYAVLRRAIFDHVLYKNNKKQMLKWVEADKFIFGEECSNHEGLSFEEICALFGWEPDYVRRCTKELERHDIKRLENNIRGEMDHKPEYLIPRSHWPSYRLASTCFLPSFFYNESIWRKIAPKRVHLYCYASTPL